MENSKNTYWVLINKNGAHEFFDEDWVTLEELLIEIDEYGVEDDTPKGYNEENIVSIIELSCRKEWYELQEEIDYDARKGLWEGKNTPLNLHYQSLTRSERKKADYKGMGINY